MSQFYILILKFLGTNQGGIIMSEENILKIEKGIIGFVVDGVMLVNCTPHPLNIVQRNGETLTVEPSGIVARCASTEVLDQAIGLIDITKQTLGNVEDLPDPVQGVYFIVSRLVASAAKRDDLLVPGALLRDDNGKVIGCKGLSRL